MSALSTIYLTFDIRSAMRQELFTPLLQNGVKYRDVRVDFIVSQFKHCGIDDKFTAQFIKDVLRVYKKSKIKKNKTHNEI
jgi:hypothetical protein